MGNAYHTIPQDSAPQPKTWIDRASTSKFVYWGGYVAHGALIVWLLARVFVVDPAERVSSVSIVGLLLGGLIAWSLTEYFFHRYLYHIGETILRKGHELHHEYPLATIGLPWFMSVPLVYGVYLLVGLWAPSDAAGLLVGAWWGGYLGYVMVHHGVHHWKFKNAWFTKLVKYHKIHHAKPDVNFGVTFFVWDWVFKTQWTKSQD